MEALLSHEVFQFGEIISLKVLETDLDNGLVLQCVLACINCAAEGDLCICWIEFTIGKLRSSVSEVIFNFLAHFFRTRIHMTTPACG